MGLLKTSLLISLLCTLGTPMAFADTEMNNAEKVIIVSASATTSSLAPEKTPAPSLVQRALMIESRQTEHSNHTLFKPSIDQVVARGGQSFFALQHQRFSRFIQAILG